MSEYDDDEEQEEIKLENNLDKELKNSLKIPIQDQSIGINPTPYKVAIIGMNELGSATAFLLICRQVVTDVIIIDQNAKRLAGKLLENIFQSETLRFMCTSTQKLRTKIQCQRLL